MCQFFSPHTPLVPDELTLARSGIGGGIIAQDLFMQKYGLKNPDGTTNASRKDRVSSIVVSVLQAGAFFGALTSAPTSGKCV